MSEDTTTVRSEGEALVEPDIAVTPETAAAEPARVHGDLDLSSDPEVQSGLAAAPAEEEVIDSCETGDHDHDASHDFPSSAKATDQVLFVYNRVRQGVADMPDANLFEVTNEVLLTLTKMAIDQTIINDQNDVLAKRMEFMEQAAAMQNAQNGLLGQGGSVFR